MAYIVKINYLDMLGVLEGRLGVLWKKCEYFKEFLQYFMFKWIIFHYIECVESALEYIVFESILVHIKSTFGYIECIFEVCWEYYRVHWEYLEENWEYIGLS